MSIDEQIKRLSSFLKPKKEDVAESALPVQGASDALTESSSSISRALMGAIGITEDAYFPPDLIGGTCPRIIGEEQEIVWNAAAEACDTERVHVVWQAFENRIWYLAVRSADLASHADSWCPLAALLSSVKEKENLPICYTYYGEEIATLMVLTAEDLNVFRGTAPVVKAKAERMSRDLGDAPVVNLDPYRMDQLTPVPWFSVSLFEDRARRVLATVSVLASLVIASMSFLVWLSASMTMVAAHHDLADAIKRTQDKSMQLIREAEAMRSSPIRSQIEKFLSVNDSLLSLNGFLDVYEIKDRKTRWRATVPPSATADRITAIGGKNIETSDQGAVIGNDAEIEYEATKGGR